MGFSFWAALSTSEVRRVRLGGSAAPNDSALSASPEMTAWKYEVTVATGSVLVPAA